MPNSNNGTHYKHLRDKWVEKHRGLQKNLWTNHKEHLERATLVPKQLVAGSMAGLLMLTQPIPASLIADNLPQFKIDVKSVEEKTSELIELLKEQLPGEVRPLNDEEEAQIASTLSEKFNMIVAPSLEGKRLNRSYGLIGAEQHLMRYPGDTMASHFDNQEDSQKYYSSGMAPGRGAWGFFAHSAAGLTEKEIQREKYYIAVPTFLSPTWKNNVNEHYKFFKYRKMLVVNPENGKAMVADIGDAGPAEWTGKHLGGSPEVMKHLERVDGRKRGPVLYYFIDDPEDVVPLGPIEVQS